MKIGRSKFLLFKELKLGKAFINSIIVMVLMKRSQRKIVYSPSYIKKISDNFCTFVLQSCKTFFKFKLMKFHKDPLLSSKLPSSTIIPLLSFSPIPLPSSNTLSHTHLLLTLPAFPITPSLPTPSLNFNSSTLPSLISLNFSYIHSRKNTYIPFSHFTYIPFSYFPQPPTHALPTILLTFLNSNIFLTLFFHPLLSITSPNLPLLLPPLLVPTLPLIYLTYPPLAAPTHPHLISFSFPCMHSSRFPTFSS